LIAPEVAKVGFIFGGSGGRAVLLVRNAKTGRWSGPVFYTLATASVGFQAGVSVSQMMTLVMTDKGLNSLMSNSFKMGPDASVAAGPVGAGAKADIITDLVTYSRAKGLYGGINLDGTVVAISEDWNEAYYGKKGARAADILRGAARSKGADRLNADIARAAGKR
jgi:lipid-binding SYLF domain-containing protein